MTASKAHIIFFLCNSKMTRQIILFGNHVEEYVMIISYIFLEKFGENYIQYCTEAWCNFEIFLLPLSADCHVSCF